MNITNSARVCTATSLCLTEIVNIEFKQKLETEKSSARVRDSSNDKLLKTTFSLCHSVTVDSNKHMYIYLGMAFSVFASQCIHV